MIRVLLVLLVYVVGPALIFWWAIKRYRTGVKPDLPEVISVCMAVIAITSAIYFMSSGMPTEEDRVIAAQMAESLVTQHKFQSRLQATNKPAVYADAEDGFPVVRIYGITDAIEQNTVVGLVEKLRADATGKPVRVDFYLREIWETGKDGSPVQARHKETLLHRYLLE